MRLSVSLLAIAATAAVAPAQFIGCTNPGNRLGLTDGWDSPTQGAGTSFVHTAGIAAQQGPGEILTRLESDFMIGWGLDPTDPTLTTKAILGYEFLIQDQNGNKLELGSEGITLESAGDLTIKASGDLTLEGTNIEHAANGNLTATGSGGAELSSSGTVKVQGSLVNIN